MLLIFVTHDLNGELFLKIVIFHISCVSISSACNTYSPFHNNICIPTIYTSLNECLRLVSGCIKSTPTDILPVLSGIEPSDIRGDKNILELRKRALTVGHMLNNVLNNPLLNNRLKSRIPLSNRMHSLAADTNDVSSPKIWAEGAWRRRWQSRNYRLKQFVPEPWTKPSGHDLNRAK